jgi:hypothetical protein
MEELGNELREAKSNGEDAAEIKAQLEAMKKKLKGRAIIPSTANRDYEVVSGGNTNEVFALTSD